MFEIPTAESITHQHILSIINTILINNKFEGEIRILDAGCGNGKLIAYLTRSLMLLHTDKKFHISGYDVRDHGVQTTGFLIETVKKLTNEIPEIDWTGRIHTIQANDIWKFSDDKYHFIISNQVLEHVNDKNLFFSNIKENLINCGYSIHLAPLKQIIHEGHIFLPWAHRISNYSALYAYIKIMSRLGFGKFKRHQNESGCTLNDYSERHADYMFFWTSYSSESETLDMARKQGLRADFRYTSEFFSSKIMRLMKIKPRYIYKYRDCGFGDALAVKFFRYLSSTTLICENKNKY